MNEQLAVGLLGYLIGSIPFAYLITRWRTGLDLRVEGTRNIGATNSYEVTKRKSVGLMVLVADLLKGLVPMLLLALRVSPESLAILPPTLVLGHCYPIWLRFHGGRGLATAAGVALTASPFLFAVWVAGYFLARRIYDQVHFGAFVATAVSLVVGVLVPLAWIQWHSVAFAAAEFEPLRFAVLIMLLIVLSRHIQPLLKIYRTRTA